MLVALAREAVRRFESGQRVCANSASRPSEHLLARHGVGSLAQRLDDLAVVERDRLVILTAAAAILALERAAVEERQDLSRG